MNNLHNVVPHFVANPIGRACTPPLVRTCDFNGCSCEEAPPLNPLTRPCRPPQELVCYPETQTCQCVVDPQPAVFAPAAAEDGCAIVAAVIVAGIKKTLLACWVDG